MAGIRETIESRCVLARENRGSFLAIYIAKVRITVHADGSTTIREGHGTGEGRGTSPGEVHDIALKAAETDATKRALATFGKPFGLALYATGKTASAAKALAMMQNLLILAVSIILRAMTQLQFRGHRGTMGAGVILWHGTWRLGVAVPRFAPAARSPSDEASIVPSITDPSPGKIDQSVLAIAEPKRIRDKAHLKFVAAQPCLICGRQPSDPHHLRFAQPMALGLKVSDEFNIPLCRGHHRQLHQAGNEVAGGAILTLTRSKSPRGFGKKAMQGPRKYRLTPAARIVKASGDSLSAKS